MVGAGIAFLALAKAIGIASTIISGATAAWNFMCWAMLTAVPPIIAGIMSISTALMTLVFNPVGLIVVGIGILAAATLWATGAMAQMWDYPASTLGK